MQNNGIYTCLFLLNPNCYQNGIWSNIKIPKSCAVWETTFLFWFNAEKTENLFQDLCKWPYCGSSWPTHVFGMVLKYKNLNIFRTMHGFSKKKIDSKSSYSKIIAFNRRNISFRNSPWNECTWVWVKCGWHFYVCGYETKVKFSPMWPVSSTPLPKLLEVYSGKLCDRLNVIGQMITN